MDLSQWTKVKKKPSNATATAASAAAEGDVATCKDSKSPTATAIQSDPAATTSSASGADQIVLPPIKRSRKRPEYVVPSAPTQSVLYGPELCCQRALFRSRASVGVTKRIHKELNDWESEYNIDLSIPDATDTAAPNHTPQYAAATEKRELKVGVARWADGAPELRIPGPGTRAYGSFICEWDVLMIGPPNTPYAGGRFHVRVRFPWDYPFKPPRFRMLTRLYHCNWSTEDGWTGLPIEWDWTPATTVYKVIRTWYNLMISPSPTDAQESSILEQYIGDQHTHDRTARAFTLKYAGADPQPEQYDIY